MQNPETRLSLLANLADPDAEQAWSEFSGLYRPLVVRVARAKGLQLADAEDLAQEVFTKLEQAIGSFEHRGAGSFRSWLFQITRHLVVNHLTRGSGPVASGDSAVRERLNQQPAGDKEAASLFLLEYRRARFQQAAAAVKPGFARDTWDAFWLTAVQRESIASVAAKLGKSDGAVRVARCRVIARLRDEVRSHEDSDILLPE